MQYYRLGCAHVQRIDEIMIDSTAFARPERPILHFPMAGLLDRNRACQNRPYDWDRLRAQTNQCILHAICALDYTSSEHIRPVVGCSSLLSRFHKDGLAF